MNGKAFTICALWQLHVAAQLSTGQATVCLPGCAAEADMLPAATHTRHEAHRLHRQHVLMAEYQRRR